MNEENTPKPLLSYEQVVDMIKERIERDEKDTCDERIMRVEKAAKELETKRGKSWRNKWKSLVKHIKHQLGRWITRSTTQSNKPNN